MSNPLYLMPLSSIKVLLYVQLLFLVAIFSYFLALYFALCLTLWNQCNSCIFYKILFNTLLIAAKLQTLSDFNSQVDLLELTCCIYNQVYIQFVQVFIQQVQYMFRCIFTGWFSQFQSGKFGQFFSFLRVFDGFFPVSSWLVSLVGYLFHTFQIGLASSIR